MRKNLINHILFFSGILFIFGNTVIVAQTGIPAVGTAKSINIPAIKESKLKNGLTVAVIEKQNVPIVTIRILLSGGSSSDILEVSGLTDFTASLLTKGTKKRTATQLAEEVDFLGGSIFSSSGPDTTSVTVSFTSDKLEQAMEILSDVVLNPSFQESEIELLRSQALDGLKYNLTQPAFIGTYVSNVYSLGIAPSSGTPQSIEALDKKTIESKYTSLSIPSHATLLFTGDISAENANKFAEKYFGNWKADSRMYGDKVRAKLQKDETRFLIVDLPDSGQTSVSYIKDLKGLKRDDSSAYFASEVLNSVLGGGYSSRLNQEIRIKRGLSYGAGSSFTWKSNDAVFSTRTQTKDESAAEVAEIILNEIKRITNEKITEKEMIPRKAVLTGEFGMGIETTGGLMGALSELYTYGLSPNELNNYMPGVNAVDPNRIMEFAESNLLNGDLIIVGDYSKFKDDLIKRFPGIKPTVIKASALDITQPGMQKK